MLTVGGGLAVFPLRGTEVDGLPCLGRGLARLFHGGPHHICKTFLPFLAYSLHHSHAALIDDQ
jgi:hypothetical protein